MPTELIAEVALRATVGPGVSPVFSYKVPPRLRGLVRPGQLVWAPLRSRRVQGVVLGLTSSARDNGLRELADIADPEATLTETGLRLAQWVADTYRAPLYEAIALLLPPGVGQEAETTWRVTPAGLSADLGALPERERAILYFLRSRGELSERALRKALRGTDAELRAAYGDLAERGLIARGAALTAPAARPRRERLARLLPPPEQLEAALEQLARAPKQRAIVEWLAGQPGVVPLAELYAATGTSARLLRELERRGLVAIETREVRRDPLAGDGVPPDQPPPLTPVQRAAFEAIAAALEGLRRQGDEETREQGDESRPPAFPSPLAPLSGGQAQRTSPVFLLHGITGSGKTEIYLRAIARALRLGRQALVLVPEIALTAQLVRRFAARFPGKLAVLHSGLSLGERYDEWRRLRRGEARLAIGSRSAVFAPLPELGLVIVDEEHELTYKHEGSPRYHARDAALHLAELTGSVTILGSATPSVESYYAAQSGRYRLLKMNERVGGEPGPDGLPRSKPLPLPPVRLIDMRRELQSGNRSIFSRPLQEALADALSRGEQAVLFLNRRGAASFVMCRDCGHVVSCLNCSSPLTVHYDEAAGGRAQQATSLLVCHTCNHRELVPAICPQCWSPRIKSFGVGTQRVVEEVLSLFPEARPLRWDRDTVTRKGDHSRMLDKFLAHEADVLVGTQMIAKGLDLPLVSVVGVVAADTGLHLPDFRAGERTFQLLTQVAGRAGRRSAGARVVIQTYVPEHYALLAAQEHDYRAFYEQEIAFRRQTGYPPFARLVRFVYAGTNDERSRRAAEALAAEVRSLGAQLDAQAPPGQGLGDWSVIGPAPAFFHRQRNRFRWHLLLRAENPEPLLERLRLTPGWSIDVDPVHVL